MIDKIYSKIFCTSYADHGTTIMEVNEKDIGLKHKQGNPLALSLCDISQII